MNLFIDVGRGSQPLGEAGARAVDRGAAALEPVIMVGRGVADAVVCLTQAIDLCLAPSCKCCVPIARVQGFEPAMATARFIGQPGAFGPLLARPGPIATANRAPDKLWNAFQEELLAQFCCCERLFRLLYRADVVTDAANVPHLPIGATHRKVSVAQPANLAIKWSPDPVFEDGPLAPGYPLEERAAQTLLDAAWPAAEGAEVKVAVHALNRMLELGSRFPSASPGSRPRLGQLRPHPQFIQHGRLGGRHRLGANGPTRASVQPNSSFIVRAMPDVGSSGTYGRASSTKRLAWPRPALATLARSISGTCDRKASVICPA